MKQTEQANPQRNVRIEHEFRTANPVTSADQSARQIDGIERLKEEQAGSLPGKNERTLEPEAGGDEQVAEIAEEKKILQTVLPPVDRRPGQYQGRPQQLEPEGDAHETVLYPQAAMWNRAVLGHVSCKSKSTESQLPR